MHREARNSQIYHRPDCLSNSRVSAKNRITSESVPTAESAGYRLAGNYSINMMRHHARGNLTHTESSIFM